MSEAALDIAHDDPVLETDFAKEIIRQMRAIDTYGTYDDWSAEKIIDPFILTKEKKREIPVIGDPDEITMSRVKAFYNAISALIEKECNLMAVGKLVVMDKTLRDVHRFGFPTLSKMKDEADKLLSVALEIIGQHPKVAGM